MMKKSMITISVLCAAFLAGTASAELTETLYPVHDAYVDSGQPSTPFGNLDVLRIQGYARGSGSFESIQRTYLMFDLGKLDIPEGAEITAAVFGIYLVDNNRGTFTAADPFAFVHYLGDDSWQQETLTWNNASTDYETEAFKSISEDMLVTGKYHEWELISDSGFQWTNYADDLANGFISLVLVTEFEDFNTWAEFYSSNESNEFKPYLKITHIIPEPATLALLAMGMGGIGVFRKKR